MTAREFEQWILFHNETPIDDQSNHHWPIAQLTAHVVNANRGKDSPTPKVSDFLLFRPRVEESGDGVGIEDVMGAGW